MSDRQEQLLEQILERLSSGGAGGGGGLGGGLGGGGTPLDVTDADKAARAAEDAFRRLGQQIKIRAANKSSFVRS